MPSKRPPVSGFARSVGARVRELRRARSVPQQRLAEVAGITQGAASNYENGVREIPMRTLLAMLDEMDIGVGEFFEGVPDLLVVGDSADIGTVRRLIATGQTAAD